MNKKSFTDSLSDEVLATIIDDTLNFKKTVKTRNISATLLKIVPAAAMIALVIGLVNILPVLLNFNADKIDPNSEITSGEKVITLPADQIELFLPLTIEKTFFEEKILDAITDARDFDTMIIYYVLNDDRFYTLDPGISGREINKLLECIRKYTDLTGDDMVHMCRNNGIPVPKNVDPAYAHVRFGATENILLLDVEWHTYDTYLEIIEEFKAVVESEEYKTWDWYINSSDAKKEWTDNRYNEYMKSSEEVLNLIKDGKFYYSKLINGKDFPGEITIEDTTPIDISGYNDENGYYIFKVYPYYPSIHYIDEYFEYQHKTFDWTYSKSDYERLCEEEIKPYLDELMEKSLITQENYDYYMKDPLQRCIDLYFN